MPWSYLTIYLTRESIAIYLSCLVISICLSIYITWSYLSITCSLQCGWQVGPKQNSKIYIFDSDLVWRMQLVEFVSVRFIFVYHIFLKQTFKNGFWVKNHLLNLFSSAVNQQMLLFSQKADVKFSYLSFLIYKIN